MENGPGLKMYFLLKMGIFHCYVSLPEGIFKHTIYPTELRGDHIPRMEFPQKKDLFRTKLGFITYSSVIEGDLYYLPNNTSMKSRQLFSQSVVSGSVFRVV